MTTWADEYITMLNDCEKRKERLTDWERTFVDSLRRQIEQGRRPVSYTHLEVQPEQGACSMTVTALTPERNLNLVVPLPHEGTAMRTTDTQACGHHGSGAVAPLNAARPGAGTRPRDVDSTSQRSTRTPTPGTRTSTTATRTTTTRAMRHAPEPSA